MGKLALLWLVGAGIPASAPERAELQRFCFDRVEMAVPIQIVLYDKRAETANKAAERAFDRIHHLNSVFSDYDSTSELRRLCETAGQGKAAPVSEELWLALTQAYAISEKTDGAFDITLGPVIRIWRRARRLHELPSPEKLAEARKLVGYHLMKFDAAHRAVELTKKGMRLDLGGIAKGYAVEEALHVLRDQAVPCAAIRAGGDMALGDPPPGKSGWVVGVAPPDADAPASLYLSLSNCSVATSGDTWQYAMIQGIRYSHIVDPKTGIGLTDHSSVTVVARDGFTSDALSTAVSVLGPEKGLKLIDSTPGAAGYIIRKSDGNQRTYSSSRWKDLPRALDKVQTGVNLRVHHHAFLAARLDPGVDLIDRHDMHANLLPRDAAPRADAPRVARH